MAHTHTQGQAVAIVAMIVAMSSGLLYNGLLLRCPELLPQTVTDIYSILYPQTPRRMY